MQMNIIVLVTSSLVLTLRLTANVFQAQLPDNLPVNLASGDGIDVEKVMPDPGAIFDLPDGTALTRSDEVLTYVARNLEPYRGFHSFMRALPGILDARPEARVVIVGGGIIVASATSCGLFGSTTYPVSPSITISGTPARRVETQGNEAAMASMMTVGIPSE